MQMHTRLHRCLADSRLAAGAGFGLNCPDAVELLVHGTELDFMVVDLQHATVSAADAVHLLRALQAADPMVTPMVRLPDHSTYWIQQSLDAGYTGLIAPLCESAEQARSLVEAAYYPPRGARSIAMSVRALLYDGYMDSINDQMILLPQIESARGLDHVEEIAAVEGVTGLLIGPADLCLSCGWSPQTMWSHEPFVAAVQRIGAACRENGKDLATMIAAESIDPAQKAGIHIICFAVDRSQISRKMAGEINEIVARVRPS